MKRKAFNLVFAVLFAAIMFTSCEKSTDEAERGDNITYTITGIESGDQLSTNNAVKLNVEVEGDDDGKQVTSAEVYIDWVLQETFTEFPFDYTMITNALAAGDYTFRIILYTGVQKVKEIEVSFTIVVPQTYSVIDKDGNEYTGITIGNQVWMTENLKVTHFRNGDEIPLETNDLVWIGKTTGARCNYKNEIHYSDTYGYLYNQYAILDERGLCPEGWHVPTRDELTELIYFLGGTKEAGSKLKEAGVTHWTSPLVTTVNDATNESGFTALPGGMRIASGEFTSFGYSCLLWTQDTYTYKDIQYGYSRSIALYKNEIGDAHNVPSSLGMSVRCIKD